MTHPTSTTTLFTPLVLRADLPREVATAYWAGPHAEKVKKLPNVEEYNQRLFSATDHGFWPATATVGTAIPAEWRLDGAAEIRFASTLAMATAGLHAREVLLDEQNVFGRVLGHTTNPGGGRWWTRGHDVTVGQHVALLVRRRRGVRGSVFRGFLRDRLSAALLAGGARDLRTYVFTPYNPLASASPGVSHDNPIQYRYHGAIVFGVDDRNAVDDLLNHPAVGQVVEQQHTALTAVHAYAIERTVPVVTTNS
ncbi:hypothetical protein ACPCIR_24095 [Mycobacterium sp. NPDC051198]